MKMNRRDILYSLAGGAISVPHLNFAKTAKAEADQVKAQTKEGPLTPKDGHLPARAKRCIMLFMEGAPSHMDTFDPKPELDKLNGKEFIKNSKFKSAMESGKRYYVKSPFSFRQTGQSGAWMCDQFRALEMVADDICFYRGAQAESVNHPTACYHMNTGNRFIGDPGIGSWVTFGLGSENPDLPGFVVLPDLNYPQGGAANWSNGYLPAHYQGTPLRPVGSPLLDLNPPKGVTRKVQKANLDLLNQLNSAHQKRHASHGDLSARMEAYDLAFRMQDQVPELVNLDNEAPHIKELYGIDDPVAGPVARRCLLARRLIEKGVRFVEVYASGWDSHDYLEDAHSARIKSVDRPIAGLIQDLKQRGLLDDTLVFFCGEFGRSPDNGLRGGGRRAGRDHNATAMGMWFAGGGVKAGHTIGKTDDIGLNAIETVHPIADVHKTILHLMGLDDNKLTFFHAGRNKQLSQVGADIIPELLA